MRAFRKDFIREITKNKGRFLSVFFIVLLGAAFFSGIRSAEGDMKVSADRYYDEVNYMDLKVLGTLGLTDDDLADIAKTDGVKAVYGGKTVEVLHDIGESEQVVKLIALTGGVISALMLCVTVAAWRLAGTGEDVLARENVAA